MPSKTAGFLLFLSLSLAGGSAAATEPPSEVWDLGDLYADVAAWETAFSATARRIDALGDCRGRLGAGPDQLAACLKRMNDTYRDLLRLFSYAYLDRDTDLRNSAANERFSRAQSLYTRYGEVNSHVQPELVALGAEVLEPWLAETPALGDYDFFVRETLRKGAHILSPREEQLLAAAADPLSAAGTAYQVFTSAEMPWPTLTLSDGETVNLSPALYTLHRAAGNRADRKTELRRDPGHHPSGQYQGGRLPGPGARLRVQPRPGAARR
jgi:oligoendopeptidase F